MPTIEEVTAKYIALRDRKAEIAKQQAEALEPLNKAMAAIESWLMHQMNQLGVDSFKTSAGTPYKANANSVKLTDAGAFKGHVFAPALSAIYDYLTAQGFPLKYADLQIMESCLQEKTKWDMVDFRAGKRGVLDFFENEHTLPPGVQVETVAVINVRRT